MYQYPNHNCVDCKPYSDDYMTFDELTGHYVLTEKSIVEKCAIDLRARLADNQTINADIVINKLCQTVSDQIYSFVHDFSIYNKKQDCLIATVPKLRAAVERAMEYQLEYILGNGDIFMSLDGADSGKEIHKLSKDILINSGICYSGV